MDFAMLYADNCAGCHGPDGHGGAAIALANPVYLRIVDDATLRSVIADGVRNTAMPAFAQRAGGMLTDAQIDVIARDIRTRWARSDSSAGMSIPSYSAQAPGNVRDGEVAYQLHCSGCHSVSGQGTESGSSITNDAFLALVSDQGLRTMIIAGRPELGAPDWRGRQTGRAMSEQEVTDIVAWLGTHRKPSPGQPYATSTHPQN
jgi:mono/diheme cytochrome c family protein